MKRIKTIYGALGRAEKKALRGYLGLFGHSKGEDKQVALLKLIEKKDDLSYEEAARKLYGDPKSKAFSMMKRRLYERMTEFLTLSLNPGRDRYDKELPYFHDLIAYRKHMLIATTLQEMRLGPIATEHFQKSLELARSCHNAELEADVLVRIRGTLQLQQLPFQEISEELHHALEATERDAHVLGVYHEFIQANNLNTGGVPAMIDYLDEHVPDLDLRLQQFYSARADYYLQILKVHHARLRRRYPEGKAAALKAQQLLQDHKGLRSRQRCAEPPYQRAILELKFEHYAEASAAFDEARQQLKPHSQSYFLLSTMMLYPLIYAGEWVAARTEGTQIASLVREGNFARHQRILDLADYLLACVAYLQGEVRSARRRLLAIEALQSDKAGWATGLRIFEIICLVDMEDLEGAEHHVEALRKHTDRHAASPRELAIIKLLRGQARQFFSFEAVEGAEELLGEMQDKHPWDPVGHEVVRVDQWYRRRQRVATT